MAEYIGHLQNLSTALNQGITRRAEDILSLDEAHKRVEAFLSRSIGQWVNNFLIVSYCFDIKKKSRKKLHNSLPNKERAVYFENELEKAVEDSLKQLISISFVVPPIQIPSVKWKPVAILFGTLVVVLAIPTIIYLLDEFLLNILIGITISNFNIDIGQVIHFLNMLIIPLESLVVFGGTQIARRVLREEQARAREVLKDQGKKIVDQFAKEAEAYLYAAAEAVEAATDEYIQKQLQLNQSIQNQLSETMEEEYDQPAQPNSSANSNAGERDDPVIHKKAIQFTA